MNRLRGIINRIEVSKSFSLVSVQVEDTLFKTIIVETPDSASYLKTGTKINLLFKETEVIIGKGKEMNISLRNKINGTISSIQRGEVLSKLTINAPIGDIKAIITTSAVKDLQLKNGEEVIAMIKTNEIMLSQ